MTFDTYDFVHLYNTQNSVNNICYIIFAQYRHSSLYICTSCTLHISLCWPIIDVCKRIINAIVVTHWEIWRVPLKTSETDWSMQDLMRADRMSAKEPILNDSRLFMGSVKILLQLWWMTMETSAIRIFHDPELVKGVQCGACYVWTLGSSSRQDSLKSCRCLQ